ncbi:uncharacterized protein LOC110180522 [Drosophila serrata]|uniref:uncharacterized protein LOC110180522 n=1 Tax=Drosophila serrata TaxID=7274 RepID=UPI000A1D0948|nr:uncharacterized protein LOC110180522 [Drosophila serrata]
MSLILCLVLAILAILVGFVFGKLRRMLLAINMRERNRLASIPVAPLLVYPEAYEPLEESCWLKDIRSHLRYVAQYGHLPPAVDEDTMPEEMEMLEELFQTGQIPNLNAS